MNSKLIVLMFKTLSRNDTGETNSHQSGISIPRVAAKTNIFPQLGIETLNPRETIVFHDEEGVQYKFEYIYYNDQFHGKPSKKSHNEFRLTRVIDFLRKVQATAGDQIWFGIDAQGYRRIGLIKHTDDIQTLHTEKINQHIKSIRQDEFDKYISVDNIPILDPDGEVTPQVVVLNHNWVKVELKR